MGDLSDEELIAGYRADGGSANSDACINELFTRYYSRVALWCYRFTDDREGAADLAQEIFTKVYRNLESFRGASRFSTWLYSIARNHCLNQLKARAARPEEVSEAEISDIADAKAEDPVDRLDRESSVAEVRALMAECLSETELKVMLLHYGEELPLATISRALNLTNLSGAKAYVVSARRKLATSIERRKARFAR